MQRRKFLEASVMAGAAFAFPARSLWAQSHDAQIEILMDEPLGFISRNIYGQFTENLGGVIYDGVWVGEDSKIPNRYGIRAALLDRLKQIRVPVVRWPGGCFADSYDWKDGIGPISQRPRRTNFWEISHDAARLHEKGPQIFDPNRFGTNEFMRFCKLCGAEPYLAANLRSLPALDFDRWVEYCNSPAGSTTLADIRQAAGFPDPFNVRYWGVGNENWGCGGNFTPEEYASEFCRFTVWVPSYGVDLQFIGSGPNDDDLDWTHRFFEQIYSNHAIRIPQFFGWSIHHYSPGGDALRFDTAELYELLQKADEMEKILCDQWAVMGQYDRSHQVKLVVDEYGPSYREGSEVDPTHLLGQQVTMRDALATALTLDTFNRHPDKVAMAANAQLINNLNALFLAHKDKFLVTPNFHVFDMYSAHQDAQALRAEFASSEIHYMKDGKPATFWGLKGSCSRKGDVVTLTVVNPDVVRTQRTQIALRAARIRSAAATVLACSDIHAHNTFDQPDAVQPGKLQVSVLSNQISVDFPAASVSKLEITVG